MVTVREIIPPDGATGLQWEHFIFSQSNQCTEQLLCKKWRGTEDPGPRRAQEGGRDETWPQMTTELFNLSEREGKHNPEHCCQEDRQRASDRAAPLTDSKVTQEVICTLPNFLCRTHASRNICLATW